MSTTAHHGEERSWWRLGRDGWRTVLKSTGSQFKADGVQNLAAVVTLRLVLALVPSLIAAVAISTFFISPSDIDSLVAQSQGFVPGDSREFVRETLERIVEAEGGGVASIVGVLAGLFAATGAAVALIQALNTAYDVEEGRGFVGQRLTALAIVGALVVTLAGMFVALVFGPSLVDLLLPAAVTESPLRFLIALGRYAAAVALLMGFFGFVFRVAPNRPEHPLRILTPGAVLGVAGWLVLSWLFSLYVRIAGNYAAYGAAAGIVILLIWLNYSFTVLLMGAELDNEIERHLGAAAHRSTDPARTDPAPTDPARTDPAHDDLDAVDPDMARHPGLVAPTPTPRPAAAGRPRPTPRLVGAAARTSGAALAGRLWGRMAR